MKEDGSGRGAGSADKNYLLGGLPITSCVRKPYYFFDS